MTTTRLTAVERREAVLDASFAEFAAHGYQGGSTDEIHLSRRNLAAT